MSKVKKVAGSSGGDVAHAIAKGALGAIPFAGGLAAELFSLLVTPPLEKRRAEWMEEVAARLKKLEDAGLDLNKLKDNPEFIDIVLQASQAVLRTSVDEKKKALANAVIHTAQGQGVNGALRQMFVSLTDQFNEWHLRMLVLAADPLKYHADKGIQWPNLYMGGFSSIIESAFPDLRGQREFYDIIWKDLSDRGLVTTPSIHTTGTGEGLKVGRVSTIGKGFLEFIGD